ncbi:MAG: hypothetical protein U0572_07415 [Phycisphaerales bacterium]
MRWLTRHAIAGWELARLALAVRFRLRGDYLRWRFETAFGHDATRMPSPSERRRAIVDYAVWTARMKSLRRR